MVKDGSKAKNVMPEKLRCRTIENELRKILQFLMTIGSFRKILFI